MAPGLLASPLLAQSDTAAAPVAVATRDPVQSAAAALSIVVPALTSIELALDRDMGSAISTTGDAFPFHLASPIVVDGRELIPAGTPGQGEVIHAKKAGGSGAAGELVLAARFLSVGDRQLRLRSLRVAIAGKDAIKAVDAFNAASAASPIPVSVIGYFITGHNIVLKQGAVVLAKTAEDFVVAGQAAAPSPQAQVEASPPR